MHLCRHRKIYKAALPPSGQESLQHLEAFLDSRVPGLVVMLTTLWQDQETVMDLDALKGMIEANHIPESVLQDWWVDYFRFADDKLQVRWVDAVRTAAGNARNRPGFVFDPMADAIQEWISSRGAQFVTNCTETQREALRAILENSYVSNHTVEELARSIRPCIGLTRIQARANMRYYAHIYHTLTQQNPDTGHQKAAGQALQAAKEYAHRQRGKRAYDIAITEMSYAYNFGAQETTRQAQEQGLIGTVMRRWSTAATDSVCEVCAALGELDPVGMNQPFEAAGVSIDIPPAHPRCQCAVAYEEVWPGAID